MLNRTERRIAKVQPADGTQQILNDVATLIDHINDVDDADDDDRQNGNYVAAQTPEVDNPVASYDEAKKKLGKSCRHFIIGFKQVMSLAAKPTSSKDDLLDSMRRSVRSVIALVARCRHAKLAFGLRSDDAVLIELEEVAKCYGKIMRMSVDLADMDADAVTRDEAATEFMRQACVLADSLRSLMSAAKTIKRQIAYL